MDTMEAAMERVQKAYAMPALPLHATTAFRFWASASGGYDQLQGRRYLDLGCGSREFHWSDDPPRTYEPWLCRLLTEAGAHAIGIDRRSLEGEPFEHYQRDLQVPGALDFLESDSLDGVQSLTLLPLLSDPDASEYEFCRQAARVLRPGGIFACDLKIYEKKGNEIQLRNAHSRIPQTE